MLVYLLKSGACLALLLLFYKLLLEKENMHLVKRYYLLVAVLCAITIPLITFTEYIEIEATPLYKLTISQDIVVNNGPSATKDSKLPTATTMGNLCAWLTGI